MICEGPGLTGEDILPDEKAWFKINYAEAGPSEPKVEIVGPDSQPVPFNVEQDGKGEQYVTYVVPKFGMFNVAVNFGGMPLPNSPYKVKIAPKVDASKVKISGLGELGCTLELLNFPSLLYGVFVPSFLQNEF